MNMKCGVLGTGMVGIAIATKLEQLGHDVMIGSRAADGESAKAAVAASGAKAGAGDYQAAAGFAEMLFNCTAGAGSLAALESAGEANLEGKILVDIANPLDMSAGMPPTLSVCNADSLGEQIQKGFPKTKVVKTLNTLNCDLMVDPSKVPGDHVLFMSGNDVAAKASVVELLGTFGWPSARVIDLGDISTARGTEMFVSLWLRLFMANNFQGDFNIEIRRAP